MVTIQRLLRTWVASSRDEEIEAVVSDISSGSTTLLNIVQNLGEYLTSEDDDLRSKGVEFLSLVLDKCPPDALDRRAARVLVTFYCHKLDDTETVVPALRGLVSLVKLPVTTSSDAVEILRAMFSHIKMKALVQSARFLVFAIINTLVKRHCDALKFLSEEFIEGYLALANGEKDPRNLLIAFAITRVLLTRFDIAKYVEGFFDITFCYFPITFRPPPNDPYGITPDDLRIALRVCLQAAPVFGPLAIPVFLEKLMAGSPATRRDSLQTLSVCIPVYGASVARDFAQKLWNSLKLEVFQSTDRATEGEALKTCQVLVKTYYFDEAHLDQEVLGFAREICDECIGILREPEKSQAKAAVKILCALLSTTASVCRYTLAQTVPHLIKVLSDPAEISNRSLILSFLSDFVIAASDVSWEVPLSRNGPVFPPLSPFKDEVLGAFISGLKVPTTATTAIGGIKGMIASKNLLSYEEIGFVVHNVSGILQIDSDDFEDARVVALDALSTISDSWPRHLQEQTLPLLFISLPDKAPPRDAGVERAKYRRALSALSKLCLPTELFETLIVRLSTKLDLLCFPLPTSSKLDDLEPSAMYAHSLLSAIAEALVSKVDNGHPDVPKYINRLIPNLFNLLICSALVPGPSEMVATDCRIVDVAARIFTTVTETLPASQQETFAAAVYSAYLTGNARSIAEGHQKIPEESRFLPFQPAAPDVQKNLVVLLAASTIALRLEVSVPVDNITDFLENLVSWSIEEASSVIQREAAWHSLASIVNKRTEDVTAFLGNRLLMIWKAYITNPSRHVEIRRNALMAWFWVSKALLVKNHGQSSQFADRLLELFSDEDMNWDAARLLGGLAAADPVLTKRHHAVIKILHAQKFYNHILPKLIEGSKMSSGTPKQNVYLVALAALVKAVPKTVYVHDIPSVMPPLIRGLDLPDPSIRANVIDTLLSVAEFDLAQQAFITEHASTLIKAMLKNCTIGEVTSPRLRASALRYLAILPQVVRYDVLHPHKSKVLRTLAGVLDDPKRSVRKEAVDARTSWFKCKG